MTYVVSAARRQIGGGGLLPDIGVDMTELAAAENPGLPNGNLGVFFGFFGVFGRRWNDPKKSKFSVFFEKKGRKVGFWGVIMDN